MFVNKDASTAVANIRWGGLIFGLFSLFMVAISFGILIGVLFNSSLSVQLIGFGIFFVSLLLSGQFIPIQVIGSVDAIKYISLLSPLSYSLGLINNSLVEIDSTFLSPEIIDSFNKGSNIFDFSNTFWITALSKNQEIINIYEPWHKGLNIFMPFALFAGFNFISWKKFKWSNR
ncbi:MAG: ABC transporter permease [Mycoplasma sp.]